MAVNLYWVVYANGTGTPSGSQIVAGQDSTGSLGAAWGNVAYTAAGTYDASSTISTLSPNTAYQVAWVAFDGISYSNVAESSAITTLSGAANATVGAWTWAGVAASFATMLSASPGQWTWSGQASPLSKTLNATTGPWSWVGSASPLSTSLNASGGAWSWAGVQAPISTSLAAGIGAWTWAGTTSNLAAMLNASGGAWSWAGVTATLAGGINASIGTWQWAGSQSSFATLVNSTTGAWSWAGSQSPLSTILNASGGSWTWAGSASTVGAGALTATVGGWTWGGVPASLLQLIGAGEGLWTWAGTTATFGTPTGLDATVGSWTWAGKSTSGSISSPFEPVGALFPYAPMQEDLTAYNKRWTEWMQRVWRSLNAVALPLPTAVAPLASPYVYRFTGSGQAHVALSGAGITQVEFSRDGTNWVLVGTGAGMYALSRSDFLKVTYAGAAPTMTLIQR